MANALAFALAFVLGVWGLVSILRVIRSKNYNTLGLIFCIMMVIILFAAAYTLTPIG